MKSGSLGCKMREMGGWEGGGGGGARRRRRRLLSACIPVCLCVSRTAPRPRTNNHPIRVGAGESRPNYKPKHHHLVLLFFTPLCGFARSPSGRFTGWKAARVFSAQSLNLHPESLQSCNNATFPGSVCWLSHVHLGKSPLKAFGKGRADDWMSILSARFKNPIFNNSRLPIGVMGQALTS